MIIDAKIIMRVPQSVMAFGIVKLNVTIDRSR